MVVFEGGHVEDGAISEELAIELELGVPVVLVEENPARCGVDRAVFGQFYRDVR